MSTSVETERSGKSVGRTDGVLLFLHLAAGLMVPFILLHPLVAPTGFLDNAAGAEKADFIPSRACEDHARMGHPGIALKSSGWENVDAIAR